MSRNKKNIVKFLIAVIALGLFTYCVVQAELDKFNGYHIAFMILSIVVFIWYGWHVFNDD